ncbi:uncharacterized protein [Neodiprion pinetum]|uniref:uncharacterized protein n=1 Tax=Neodiprion pinetum TaxID=441929 RepID=UPI001EDFF677|nr:uncharacterized protein LOC124224032 [Neodiprion pinetum]
MRYQKLDQPERNCPLQKLDGSNCASTDILQIAAKSQSFRFCSYVNPTQVVDARASAITGLNNVAGELHLHGQRVDSIPIKDALVAFYEFLKLFKKPFLLVAHNATFYATRLVLAANGHSMTEDFQLVVVGFSDTLPLLKKIYLERKGPGMFKLEKLAEDILNLKTNTRFHDALYDVEILEQLSVVAIDIASFFTTCERFIERLNNCIHNIRVAMALPYLEPLKNVISAGMLKKMASAGITYDRLKEVQKTSGKNEVVNSLSERIINKKPLVTDSKRILLALTDFLAKNVS